MGYPDPLYTVCCVAEIESNETGACPECNGTQLQTHFYYEPDGDGFEAEVYLSGASLERYSFDQGPYTDAPAEYPGPKWFIPYPPGFKHLCLRYNREGGARINVVAVNMKTGHKIRPSNIMAKGTDNACPVESASVDDKGFPVEIFQWDDTQPTDRLNEYPPGAWTIAPGEVGLTGLMVLTFRQKLLLEDALPLNFVSWERNLLTHWIKDKDEHKWPGKERTIDEFDNNMYAGIVAYYEPLGDPTKRGPDTLPGPDSLDEPARKVVRTILSPLLWVWSLIVAFVKRVFVFLRW